MGYSLIPYCRSQNNNKYLTLDYSPDSCTFKVAETVKHHTLENCRIANARIQYRDYIRFMYDYQLKCYKNSNYKDLFNFMSFLINKKKQQNLISTTSDQNIHCWNNILSDTTTAATSTKTSPTSLSTFNISNQLRQSVQLLDVTFRYTK